MCGIAGIFEPERRPETPALVARMLSRIAHRGPNGEGLVADDAPVDRAVLGHRRLAIFDLTDAARQPMSRDGERWWIVYNGAIYNAPELRAELEACGERFTTRSDTEVLLVSWIRWGRAALSRLNGMWAFAIWDRVERKLVCCRDRYGVKPLYWARDAGGRFAFASEPKALRPFLAAEPDDEIVRSFFRTGLSVGSGDRTIYRNYRSVREGVILEVSAKGERESRWYVQPVPGPIESLPRDTRSAREEFFDLFSDAVSIRLRSDAPVGVFLSGGMDSSSILAASSALPARERGGFAGKTISLAYPDAPEIDESGYAWTMARRTNCEPEFVVPDAAGLEAEMDELARTLDDLTFHHGFYAMKLLSRRARERGNPGRPDGTGRRRAPGRLRAVGRPFAGALVGRPQRARDRRGVSFRPPLLGNRPGAATTPRKPPGGPIVPSAGRVLLGSSDAPGAFETPVPAGPSSFRPSIRRPSHDGAWGRIAAAFSRSPRRRISLEGSGRLVAPKRSDEVAASPGDEGAAPARDSPPAREARDSRPAPPLFGGSGRTGTTRLPALHRERMARRRGADRIGDDRFRVRALSLADRRGLVAPVPRRRRGVTPIARERESIRDLSALPTR